MHRFLSWALQLNHTVHSLISADGPSHENTPLYREEQNRENAISDISLSLSLFCILTATWIRVHSTQLAKPLQAAKPFTVHHFIYLISLV